MRAYFSGAKVTLFGFAQPISASWSSSEHSAIRAVGARRHDQVVIVHIAERERLGVRSHEG